MKLWVKFGLSILAGWLIAGCAAHKLLPSSGPLIKLHEIDLGELSGPRVHAIQKLGRAGAELSNMGMYTYVLLNAPTSIQDPSISDEVRSRFNAILDALGTTTPDVKVLPEAISTRDINIFCVPVKELQGSTHLENYNFRVASQYIAQLQSKIRASDLRAKLNSPGPFLVSTRARLEQSTRTETLLFADFSNQNPHGIGQAIFEYKIHVMSRRLTDEEFFNPIKLRLASWLLDASENVILVKTAIARIIE